MSRSATEPVWDTTGGKFGPFAGQCFIGELTESLVMRGNLEEVKGPDARLRVSIPHKDFNAARTGWRSRPTAA